MAVQRFLAPLALLACTEATPPGPTPEELELHRAQRADAALLFQNNDDSIRGKILRFMQGEDFQENQKKCEESLEDTRIEKGDQKALPFECGYETSMGEEKVKIVENLHRETREEYDEFGDFRGERSYVQNTISLEYEDTSGRFVYTYEPAGLAATERGTPGSLTVTVQTPVMQSPYTVVDYANIHLPYGPGEKQGELSRSQEDFLRLVKNQTYLSVDTPVESLVADRALRPKLEALVPEVSQALKDSTQCRKEYFKQLKAWRVPNDHFIEEEFNCEETYTTPDQREIGISWSANFIEEEGIQNLEVKLSQPRTEATFDWHFGLKRGQLFDYESVSVESAGGSWAYETGLIHRDTLDNFAGPYTKGEKTPWAEGLLDDFLSGGENHGLRYPDFKLDKYRAPKGGTVVKRFEGSFKKTVIVLPDLHVDAASTREQNLKAQKVQDYQALVLKDLAEKYGTFDLVLENIPEGMPQAYLAMQFEFAAPVQGEFTSSAAQFLAYNPYSVRVIGPVTQKQLQDTMAHLETSRKATHALQHPWETPCINAPQFNLAQAIGASEQDNPNPALKECFCTNVEWIKSEAAWMTQDRFIDAPHKEAQAALMSPSTLAVVIAGKNHQAKIEEDLRLAGASYAVIEPSTVRLEASKFPVLEDPKGICQ